VELFCGKHRLEKHLSRLFGRLRARFGAALGRARQGCRLRRRRDPHRQALGPGDSERRILTIINNGTTLDRLSDVSSHGRGCDENAAGGRRLEIKPGETVTLRPSGQLGGLMPLVALVWSQI
jgi:hypothetical protein